MIRYDLPVLIGQQNTDPGPEIKCHDTGIVLAVHLEVAEKSKWLQTRKPYIIPEGTKALLQVAKPDGTSVKTDRGISIDGENTVICENVVQAFTAAGVCNAEIVLYSPDAKRLTTATFTYEVTQECVCDTDTPSADYFDILGEEIKRAVSAAERAEDAARKAEDAAGVGSGYYIPAVEQVDESTAKMTFAESVDGMQPVPDQTFTLPKGPKGDPGEKGDPGKDGADGPPGADGKDGANGKDGKDGYSPARGTDYWTPNDIAEIKSYVDEAILGGAW